MNEMNDDMMKSLLLLHVWSQITDCKIGDFSLKFSFPICFYNPLWPKWGQLAALYAIKGYFYQQE